MCSLYKIICGKLLLFACSAVMMMMMMKVHKFDRSALKMHNSFYRPCVLSCSVCYRTNHGSFTFAAVMLNTMLQTRWRCKMVFLRQLSYCCFFQRSLKTTLNYLENSVKASQFSVCWIWLSKFSVFILTTWAPITSRKINFFFFKN